MSVEFKRKKFFAFPICALSYPAQSNKHLLSVIMGYCVLESGRSFHSDMDYGSTLDAMLPDTPPKDYVMAEDDHDEVMIGLKIHGLTTPSVKEIITEHRVMSRHIEMCTETQGAQPLVSIANSLLWGCYKDGDPSFELLSLLCAVNSELGLDGSAKIVRRERLLARMMGYSTVKSYQEALKTKREKRKPLTVSQLRTRLDMLEKGGFFKRCIASPRNTYFAPSSMSYDKLREIAVERLDRLDKVADARAKDRELMAQRRAKKAANSSRTIATGSPQP